MTALHPISVALDLPLRTGDAAFTFAAGPAAGAPRGAGVVVPFGRRLMTGIVLGEGTPRTDLRSVLAVVEPAPLVPAPVVALAEWTALEYLSSVGEALTVAVPWDALWDGLVLGCSRPDPVGLSQAAATLAARFRRAPVTLHRASRFASQAPHALEELAAAGVLAVSWRRSSEPRSPESAPAVPLGRSPAPVMPGRRRSGRLAMPPSVETAVREAMRGDPRALVVAGWNRAPVYLMIARIALDAGRSCLAMFPSVDAAAAFARAAAGAGLAPVLVHGDLPPPARRSAWESLRSARGMLVIGTRAAVFAPVADPVVAIVDDEDNSGHKEERAPRFVTRVVAEARTRDAGVLVVGAATPPVATWVGVEAGRLRLVALPSPRPRIGVVDLRRRPDPGVPVSRPVLDAVRRVGRSGGRAVVLADRKGYAGGLHCAECGGVERCAQCGVALFYDRGGRRLACRVCGFSVPAPNVCSRCGAARLRLLGAGTERLAAFFRRLVPRVWRLDADVVAGTGDATTVLAPFRDQGGVLVATTLVVPWLEWLRPDLVAVVSADRWLHRPEFRAAERFLALLRTLSMASRTRVLVETSDLDHPALLAAAAPSLRPFYAEETALRRALDYPPFRSLVAVVVSARSAAVADAVIARLTADAAPPTDVLGPSPVPATVAGRVERRLVLKVADRSHVRELLWPWVTGAAVPSQVRVVVDVDPVEL
jgi:primosomal protein N' (replication factor Y)